MTRKLELPLAAVAAAPTSLAAAGGLAHEGVRSWGLPGPFVHRLLTPATLRELALPADDVWLSHGNGRSYGDVALNAGHTLVRTRWLDRYLAFDEQTGVLACEAGVQLSAIVDDFAARRTTAPMRVNTRRRLASTCHGVRRGTTSHHRNHGEGGQCAHPRRIDS